MTKLFTLASESRFRQTPSAALLLPDPSRPGTKVNYFPVVLLLASNAVEAGRAGGRCGAPYKPSPDPTNPQPKSFNRSPLQKRNAKTRAPLTPCAIEQQYFLADFVCEDIDDERPCGRLVLVDETFFRARFVVEALFLSPPRSWCRIVRQPSQVW